ncbi:MAG: lysine decarboxylase [Synechococcaceae cyanobacterium]|nr:lysine decarboxylase [Synechococcaceae cyanobacterium]
MGAPPWRLLQRVLGAPAPPLPLHLPAHGRGRALAPGLRQLLRQPPGRWDLPELPGFGGPLEDEGAVAEAQRRCAELFGVDHLWFGVNGASGLLQAALLALAPPGGSVLLPRNLHRSLLHACVLGDLQPLLYDLPFDPATGLWRPCEADRLRRVLQQAGPVAALVLVDPTYQGLRAELAELVALAHGASGPAGRGLPVLVDQAHGCGEAVAAGADLVVLSLQKAAGGLAQSAALLARGPRVDPEALQRSLLWLQTSSPSALLLASTAAAIEQLHSAAGRRQRRRAEGRAARLRQRLQDCGLSPLPGTDPLRLVLPTAPLGFSGQEVDDWLLQRGVVAELPEPGALTFCLGLDPPAGLERRLPAVLLELRRQRGGPPLPPWPAPPLPLLARLAWAPGRAWRAAAELVPLAEACGRIAARPICPYPPGIPLLVPGERIDAGRLEWLETQRQRWPEAIADTVSVVAGS